MENAGLNPPAVLQHVPFICVHLLPTCSLNEIDVVLSEAIVTMARLICESPSQCKDCLVQILQFFSRSIGMASPLLNQVCVNVRNSLRMSFTGQEFEQL